MDAAIDTFSTMNLFNKTVADLAIEGDGKSRVVIIAQIMNGTGVGGLKCPNLKCRPRIFPRHMAL